MGYCSSRANTIASVPSHFVTLHAPGAPIRLASRQSRRPCKQSAIVSHAGPAFRPVSRRGPKGGDFPQIAAVQSIEAESLVRSYALPVNPTRADEPGRLQDFGFSYPNVVDDGHASSRSVQPGHSIHAWSFALELSVIGAQSVPPSGLSVRDHSSGLQSQAAPPGRGHLGSSEHRALKIIVVTVRLQTGRSRRGRAWCLQDTPVPNALLQLAQLRPAGSRKQGEGEWKRRSRRC